MTALVFGLIGATAMGQDSPWGDLLEPKKTEPKDAEPPKDEPVEEPDVAPPAAEPTDGAAPADAPADGAVPGAEAVPAEPEAAGKEKPPKEKAPKVKIPKEKPLETQGSSEEEAARPTVPPWGLRIDPMGGPPGIGISQANVVGGDGGTFATTISAHWGVDSYHFAARLPFAGYRTPDDRETNLGNLVLQGWYLLPPFSFGEMGVGLELRANVGDAAWTWTHQAEELWPVYGAAGIWQMRQPIAKDTVALYRGSFGIYGAPGYEPFPSTLVRFTAAGAIDRTIWGPIGVTGELAVSYWDVSPFELTALVRGDPIDGLRLRGGFLMPLFVWSGWSPADQPSGMRELMLLLDVSMAL